MGLPCVALGSSMAWSPYADKATSASMFFLALPFPWCDLRAQYVLLLSLLGECLTRVLGGEPLVSGPGLWDT